MMKPLFFLCVFLLSCILTYAQNINPPSYINIDSSATTAHKLNYFLQQFAPGYKPNSADSTAGEKKYTYINAAGNTLTVVYNLKMFRGVHIISKVAIRGNINELEIIYNKLFKANRKMDIEKNTYQLDYFMYNERKFYVQFDPDRENNAGTDNWSIIIGKY